jgi:hypothetical protein
MKNNIGSDRNQMIAQIDQSMGSEGSHEMAEKMYEYIRENTDLIGYSDNLLIWTREFEENEFFEIWTKIAD